MSGFGLAGGWFRYYTEQLPQQALDDPNSTVSTVGNIFSGLEDRITKSTRRYQELQEEDQRLLNTPLRIIIKAKTRKPFAYFTYELDSIRKGVSGALNETDTPRCQAAS